MDNALKVLEIALMANENAAKDYEYIAAETEKQYMKACNERKENQLNRLKLQDAIAVLRSTSLTYPGVTRNWPNPVNLRHYQNEATAAAQYAAGQGKCGSQPVNDADRKYGAMWGVRRS